QYRLADDDRYPLRDLRDDLRGFYSRPQPIPPRRALHPDPQGWRLTMDAAEVRLEEFEKRVMQRFELTALALKEAQQTMEKRLDGMNEFRDALKDQANRMATRAE